MSVDDLLLAYLLGFASALASGAATLVIYRGLDLYHQRQCARLQIEAIAASTKRAQQEAGLH